MQPLRRAVHGRSGFSLVEVLIAVLVLVMALSAFIRSLVGTVQLGRSNRESALAMEGARRAIEGLYAADFDEVYALYNSNAADDPPGDAPGPSFEVAALEPLASDADGMVGEVRFPTVGSGAGLKLREDVVDVGLGMPRDLNGDAAIDGLDHAGDYSFLPVEVAVRWQGRSGAKEITLKTLVVRR
jgi:prepilin-type N-terminal cleavage/methylation domain-containing protein